MDDLKKLERDLKRMEKFPTKFLKGAVHKAAKPLLAEAKARAPKKSGTMIAAMILHDEKSKTTGKRFTQVTFDSAYNDRLAKESKTGKRSYYPASQEFGWIKQDGTKVPGKHFMRDAADAKESEFDKIVIEDMMGRIEKAWKGK